MSFKNIEAFNGEEVVTAGEGWGTLLGMGAVGVIILVIAAVAVRDYFVNGRF